METPPNNAIIKEKIKEFFIPKLEKNTPPKSRDNPSEIAKDLVF